MLKGYLLAVRKSSHVFLAVIKALFLRELNMRMSTGRIGLFWTFFEPFAQVGMFVLIRVAIIGKGAGSNYDFAVFMASGFIAFNVFRNVLGTSAGAFIANKALFTYRQVKPIDTIISRLLVEIFISSIIIILFLFIGFIVGSEIKPENMVLVAAGYFWLIIFSFAMGLLVAIGNTFFLSIGKIVSIMSFGLMIFSGVFYPMESIPIEAQEILIYNPLIHFMEMIHANYIYELDDGFVDYIYMLKWTITPLFVAMWLYVRLEKKIISL